MAALIARQASFVQLKDSQNTHKENFATVCVVIEVNMVMARFFCFNFKESKAMQRMTLLLDLARERLLAVIVMKRQGLWRERPLTESTTIGWDWDAHIGGEQRWRDTSRDMTLVALDGTYFIRN